MLKNAKCIIRKDVPLLCIFLKIAENILYGINIALKSIWRFRTGQLLKYLREDQNQE